MNQRVLFKTATAAKNYTVLGNICRKAVCRCVDYPPAQCSTNCKDSGGSVVPCPADFVQEGSASAFSTNRASHSERLQSVDPHLLSSGLNKPSSLSIFFNHHVLCHPPVASYACSLFLCAQEDLFCGSHFLAMVHLRNATRAHAVRSGMSWGFSVLAGMLERTAPEPELDVCMECHLLCSSLSCQLL